MPDGNMTHARMIFDAPALLTTAADTIVNRAVERDNEAKAERSMGAAVSAFNALYGAHMSETQGWMFMAILKAARARQGRFNIDDFIDGAAYFALAGEAEANAYAEGTNG